MRVYILFLLAVLPVLGEATWSHLMRSHRWQTGRSIRDPTLRKYASFLKGRWRQFPKRMERRNNCVIDAVVNAKGECVCQHGYHGNGYLFCWNPLHYCVCSFCDDISMNTFGQQGALIYPIGAIHLAQVCTARKFHWVKKGKCDISVNGWTERVRGKVFIKGLQICLTQDWGIKKEVNFLVNSTAVAGGSYCWTIAVRTTQYGHYTICKHYCINNPSATVHIVTKLVYGCAVEFKVKHQHVLTVNFKCCGGVTLGFKQFHMEYPVAVPGFYISIPKTAYVYPKVYVYKRYPICLDPKRSILDISNITYSTGITDRSDAMTFTALTNVDFEKAAGIAPGQKLLAYLLCHGCSESLRSILFSNAGFMLSLTKITRCINEDNMGLSHQIRLFTYAAKWFCKGDSYACGKAQEMIDDKCGHLLKRPKVDSRLEAFMQINCKAS